MLSMKIRSLRLPGGVGRAGALAVMLSLLAAATGSALAALQSSYLVSEGKQTHAVEIATDEFWVHTDDRREVRAATGPFALTNVAAQVESFRQATGQEADLVLYPVGLPKNEYTRLYVTRSLLVQLEAGVDAQEIGALVNAESVIPVSYAPGYWLLRVSNGAAALTGAEALRSRPGVKFAEAQFARQAQKRLIPNDPLFGDQWHLLNTGQTSGTPGIDVGVTEVWDTYQGSGVVIGIVDDGLQLTHPDLAPNVVAGLSFDWNGNDNDPSPNVAFDFHGTACAGCAAARGNNGIGLSGSAPLAGLAGLRLIAGPSTDQDDAESVLHQSQAIQVKNNSWGPADFGFIAAGPGPLAAAALVESATTGRGGLGTIHLWAGGNGRDNGDHANYDGWANSIYTIGVGACNDFGQQVVYSESGANLVIVAPSLDFPSPPRPGISTTDLVGDDGYNGPGAVGEYADFDYTRFFSGTSAATPIAAGVVALVLEANPNLGWRDVQEILIRSATFVDQQDGGWFVNAAGLRFNNKYGAGLINASNAVALAQSWVNLDPHTNAAVEAAGLSLAIPDNSTAGVTQELPFLRGNMRLEHVTLTVDIQHSRRGDLEIELISPSGTRSVVAEPRPADGTANLNGWTFMTVQFWGENAFGTWRVVVRDRAGGGVGSVSRLRLELWGTPSSFNLPVLLDNYFTGGNGNGIIDFNECNNLYLVLGNISSTPSTRVQVSLSTTTPGVALGTRVSDYADLQPGTTGTNLVPFTLSTAPTFICGTPITVTALVKSDQGSTTNTLQFTSGTNGIPLRFNSTSAVAVPDNNPQGTNSAIFVTNILTAIRKVTVSLHVTHTWLSDLQLELIGPDGTTVLLSANHGGSADNYGASCSPDIFRTTFDDDAGQAISGAAPPFVGTFRPDAPLSTFIGKSGTNANGFWRLRVVDQATLDVGVLQCWSLFVTGSECLDGGGTCPGADMALGFSAAPNPVSIGSNLVYTVSVTNLGPSEAKNVVVNQALPGSVVFVSGSASQGSVVSAGGTAIINLGTMPFTGVATASVVVSPTIAGTISSTATLSSGEADPDTANNTSVVTSVVIPPTSDLAVGLLDSPDPALVGAGLTYTVSVTNRGPSMATGVTVTNTLPVSVAINGATASQGFATISGNIVIFTFGTMTNGARTSGTINVTPFAEGVINATAVASANQGDPVPGNNTATVVTTVGPAADLVIGLADLPDPVVVGSNWTYYLTVTNRGPSQAGAVFVNHTLPAGVSIVSTNTTQGVLSLSGNVLVGTLGPLPNGAGAAITVVVNATNSGNYVSTANVSGSQADPNTANNSASVTTTVAPPTVSIVAAGATLTAESVLPANGTVDVGETVTVLLRLRNGGNISNTNLVATLLPTGGVTSPSPATPVNYGVLPPGGLPVAQPFTFTATGPAGGAVVATLQLQDGVNNLGTVSFNFALPNVWTFANTNRIAITDNQPIPWPAGPASPYPSTNLVSGVSGLVGKVSVTLSNLNHSFPDDLDVLLVGPNGQKVILMSDAGGANAVANATVTFDDGASTAVPDSGQILSSSYRPAAYEPGDAFDAPAPAGPYDTSLSTFAAGDPNGVWSLYIMDDSTGDPGNVGNGWRLAITTIAPVNQVADLGLAASVSATTALVGDHLAYTFTVTNRGPNTATGIAFTNLVPAGASLLSAGASQGTVFTNAGSVFVSLGAIDSGSSASVTVGLRPTVLGTLINTATVSASENDLNQANNTVSASTVVTLPVADVGLGKAVSPDSVVLGSNINFTISVTNHGPQNALNVVVTDPLPAGQVFVSGTVSRGSVVHSSGTVIASLGDLPPGQTAEVTILSTATSVGTHTNFVSVATGSSDTNAANNTDFAVLTVTLPTPGIVPAGAVLLSESQSPANGAVDIGETVTLSLRLANTGSAGTANLMATLLATGGVTAPSGPQNYGALAPGAPAVARDYSFTAAGANGDVVVATLQLQDGATDLGTVTFNFPLPATTSLANPATILIPEQGGATPYPSTIHVSGLEGLVSRVQVALNGVTHGFPDDLDVLLVGPNNQKVMLMSDAGGGHGITNLLIQFDDDGPVLPNSSPIAAGTYAPTDYEPGDAFPPPVPSGTPSVRLNTLNSIDPNGAWSLYIVDDSTGDGGNIGGGWTLTLTTISPVSPVADLSISLTDSPDPIYVGGTVVYTIQVMNHGPFAATGVMVTDALPVGASFASAFASQGSTTNVDGVVTCDLGDLEVGGAATVTIRATANIGGTLVNSVSVSAVETDLNPANNTAQTTTVVLVPAPAILGDVVVTNGIVQFNLTGEPNFNYSIEASTDLMAWVSIGSGTTAANGTLKFTDLNAPAFGYRFYRSVALNP